MEKEGGSENVRHENPAICDKTQLCFELKRKGQQRILNRGVPNALLSNLERNQPPSLRGH